jgi:putative flippase GtrA
VNRRTSQSLGDSFSIGVIVSWLNAPIVYIANRFGGKKSKEVERFLKFSVVGVTGAVVDFSTLIVLQTTLLPPADSLGNPLPMNVTIATATAFIAAVVSNFIWTRLWVYPDSRSRSVRRQLAQFGLISVIGGTARTIWVRETFFWFGQTLMPVALPVFYLFDPAYQPSPTAEGKLGSIVAQLIGMAVVMLWNFFANRYWTYNDVD